MFYKEQIFNFVSKAHWWRFWCLPLQCLGSSSGSCRLSLLEQTRVPTVTALLIGFLILILESWIKCLAFWLSLILVLTLAGICGFDQQTGALYLYVSERIPRILHSAFFFLLPRDVQRRRLLVVSFLLIRSGLWLCLFGNNLHN